MGTYSRVSITWRGMRAVRAIGYLRHSHPGSIADVVKRPVVLRNRGSGAACPGGYAKSPQPLRVCGLAWNSGGAGIRSVALGLHQALGVGELVELIDVGLGNHDVDGREHE